MPIKSYCTQLVRKAFYRCIELTVHVGHREARSEVAKYASEQPAHVGTNERNRWVVGMAKLVPLDGLRDLGLREQDCLRG